MKNQAAPVRGPEAYVGQAYPIGGQPVPPTAPAHSPLPIVPTPQPSNYSLTALDGPLTGQRFAIGSRVEIGREQPVIPLSFDSQVSRRHAAISPDYLGLTLTDLNSTNGTFVNGQRVQTQTLHIGDLVKIGATTFRVD
jgi:pSer/pThr/pTyr-binding forkhead associated (FHA) protein